METINWLPEHSAALRDLRARGMSYSEIADTINTRFRTAYTRDAALGRAQRMGLGGLDRPEPSLPGCRNLSQFKLPDSSALVGPTEVRGDPGASRTVKPTVNPAVDLLRRPPKTVTERVEASNLRCAEVAPRHLSLLELGRSDCHYPYGGDSDGEAITFCGHPCRLGSNYCTPHFRLSRDPQATATPILSDAWLDALCAK